MYQGLREFYHKFMYMYIAPSSDCSLLTLSLPFKVILRWFVVAALFKDWWKYIQIHQYYTMALTFDDKKLLSLKVFPSQAHPVFDIILQSWDMQNIWGYF